MQQGLCVSFFVFANCKTGKRISHIFFSLSEMEISPFGPWIENCSSRPFEDCYPTVCIYECPSSSGAAVFTEFKVLISLHLFSVVNALVQRKPVTAHVQPATINLTGFTGQTVDRAFIVLARPTRVGSVHLLEWFVVRTWWFVVAHTWAGRVEGSWMRCNWLCAPRTAHFSWDQHNNYEWGTSRRVLAALRRYPEEDGAFWFLNNMVFSPTCTASYDMLVYVIQNLDGWDAVEEYQVEEGYIHWCFACFQTLSQKFQIKRASTLPPVGIKLDRRDTLVSCGRFPLQAGVLTPAIISRVEEHHVLYRRGLQEIKALKG